MDDVYDFRVFPLRQPLKQGEEHAHEQEVADYLKAQNERTGLRFELVTTTYLPPEGGSQLGALLHVFRARGE